MTTKNRATVKIVGNEYTIKGLETEEYLHKLGFLVDKKMSEIITNNNMLSTYMAAVLTALNFADDFVKSKEENNALQDELKKVKEELENNKKENEKIINENEILVSSNTQLQLELSKSESELREARKSMERFSKKNDKNLR